MCFITSKHKSTYLELFSHPSFHPFSSSSHSILILSSNKKLAPPTIVQHITGDADVANPKPNCQMKTNLPNKSKKLVVVEQPNEPKNLLAPVIAKMIHSQLVVINEREREREIEDKNSDGIMAWLQKSNHKRGNLFCSFRSCLATTRSTT